MTVGQSHEVSIGGVEYRVKFGTSSVFEHGYQAPFIERQSVSASRSEGDYSGDLVFTQSSWAAGEGVKTMRTGTESNYWYSEDIDVSGNSSGAQLLKGLTKITSGASQPAPTTYGQTYNDVDAYLISTYPSSALLYYIFKPDNATSNIQVWRWTGSAWDSGSVYYAGRPTEYLMGATEANGYAFMLSAADSWTSGGISRSDDFSTDWCTDTLIDCIGGDRSYVYYWARDAAGILKISASGAGGAAGSAVGSGLGGIIGTAFADHAGAMFCTATSLPDEGDQSYLHRDNGTNFVLYKKFPEGFIAQSMISDGSVLYIGGKYKCDEGNYRGRIYYLSGATGSETLGVLTSFGERDGTTDYEVDSMAVQGGYVYFSWNTYGGVGRYDTTNSGISRSYRQTTQLLEGHRIASVAAFKGDMYFTVRGLTATTDNSAVYKSQSSAYATTGTLQGSYADFGLPVSQKLYTKVVVVTPTLFSSYAGADVAVSYSVDGNTSTWTSLSASLAGETADTDSSAGFYKYTLTMPNNGLKAHSLAVKLVLTRSTATTDTPQISYVTTVAKPLLNTPGTTSPLDTWRFNVVIAENCRTMTGAIEARQNDTKMANLRTLFEAQGPTALITMAEPDTTHQVLIKNLAEVSPSKARNNSYEATVNVECVKV